MLTIAHYCEKHEKTQLLYDFQTKKEKDNIEYDSGGCAVIEMYCPKCEGGKRKLKVDKK